MSRRLGNPGRDAPRCVVCAAVVCAALCVGCPSAAESERRAEFERIDQALRQVQRAPLSEGSARLEHLVAVPCLRLCDFRRRCKEAYGRFFLVRSHIAAVRRELHQEAPEPHADERSAARMMQVQRELDRARESVDRCITEQGRLSRGR